MILTFPHIRERHPWMLAVLRVAVVYLAYSLIVAAHTAIRDDVTLGTPFANGWILPIERLLGDGEAPTERLQNLWFSGHYGWLEWASVGAHLSFFVGPFVLLLYLAAFRWRSVVSALICFAAVYFASDLFSVLFPTKPPWMTLPITRIVALGHADIAGIDPNPFAAFPSLHVGLSAGMGVWAWRQREHAVAWLLAVQTALIFFAVVYTGEHYVIDGLAGVLLSATVARVISSHVTPLNGRRLA